MVQTLGYAGTGNLSHPGRTPLPGPKPGIRPAHRPWCRDCKHTMEAAQLDDEARCARCAATHAEAEDRSELRARVAAQVEAEERAARLGVPVHQLPTEGKQGQPTPRRSARKKSASSSTRRARVARPSTTTENPPATRETRPSVAGGPRNTGGRKPAVDLSAADERAIVESYRAGETIPPLAERYSLYPGRVRRILERSGVEMRDDRARAGGASQRRIDPDPEVRAEAVRLYLEEQLSVDAVAHRIGFKRRIVLRILDDAGVDRRPAAHQTGGTALTDDQAAEIVRAYVAGEASLSVLGERFGIRGARVRELVTAAGHPIRSKGASNSIGKAMADLGVTAREVRGWAREQHHDVPDVGILPRWVVDAYAAAHQDARSAS